MRIGFFTDDYFPRKDGVSYTLKTWKERLEERGHEVYIVYPGSRDYRPEKGEKPVRSIKNPFYHGHHIGIPLGTSNFPEVDVVHVHSPGPVGLAARYWAYRNDVPSVFSFHTPLEDYLPHLLKSNLISGVLEPAYMGFSNRFLKSFDAVTSNTGNIERDVDPEIIPVGIDTDFFSPVDSDMLGEIERPIAGYCGRISEEKNLDEIVDAAHDFDGSIVIAGEGRHRESLEKKAPENVHFRDFLPREELPEFMSSLDVFVTASTSETFCLSALEANSCGTPVVAPDVEPFTRTIDERNGLRYRSGNTEDLLEKLESCLAGSFSPRSRVKEFSVVKTMERLEKIYSELV